MSPTNKTKTGTVVDCLIRAMHLLTIMSSKHRRGDTRSDIELRSECEIELKRAFITLGRL